MFGNRNKYKTFTSKDNQTEELKDLILGQMKFKKESHYLELGETGLTKNLSKQELNEKFKDINQDELKDWAKKYSKKFF